MTVNRDAFGKKKRILMVVANPAVSTTLGWPVGFWASELTHAWHEFDDAGYDTTIASPDGGAVTVDALSDPRDASGYSAEDVLSLGFLTSPRHAALLEATSKLSSLRPEDFDALYVAGGQSPMFTFRNNAALSAAIRTFFESSKPVTVVCHGTAALLDVALSNGEPLIKAKLMTGFANSEEDYADSVVGRKVMPFRIEDEALARGARFVAAPAFRPHAVRDGNLITGQQQYSGRRAAVLTVRALGS